MRKILLVLLAVLVTIGLTACSSKEELKLDPVSLEAKEISDLPSYLEGYLEEERLEETYQALALEEGILLFAARGEMRTGGYSINLDKAGINNGKLYVEVTIQDPAKGSMVTEALTYPMALALVEGENLPQKVVFVQGNDYQTVIKEVEVVELPANEETIATIYFGTPEGYLRAETRIIEGELNGRQGKELIEEIVKGTTATDDTLNVLPAGTQVLDYQYDEARKLATIDFSEHINAVQGSMGESLAIYAIVNTLTELPGVEKVQFLVEGKKVETIGGHIYMYDPLERELFMLEGNMLK